MANELQTLADRINASRQTASPGSASGTLLGYLAELVDLLRVDKEVPGSDSDAVKIDALNRENNRLNGILQQIKLALHQPQDQTMTQLPAHAVHVYSLVNPNNL